MCVCGLRAGAQVLTAWWGWSTAGDENFPPTHPNTLSSPFPVSLFLSQLPPCSSAPTSPSVLFPLISTVSYIAPNSLSTHSIPHNPLPNSWCPPSSPPIPSSPSTCAIVLCPSFTIPNPAYQQSEHKSIFFFLPSSLPFLLSLSPCVWTIPNLCILLFFTYTSLLHSDGYSWLDFLLISMIVVIFRLL